MPRKGLYYDCEGFFAKRPKFQSEVLEQKKELARKEENINKIMNRLAKNGHQIEIDREEKEQKMELFTGKVEEMINSFKRSTLQDLQTKQESEASRINSVFEKCVVLENELGELIKAINIAKAKRPVSLISVFLSNEDKLHAISKTLENDIARHPQTVLSKDVDSLLHEMQKLL